MPRENKKPSSYIQGSRSLQYILRQNISLAKRQDKSSVKRIYDSHFFFYLTITVLLKKTFYSPPPTKKKEKHY